MAKISLMFLLSLVREHPQNGPSHKPEKAHSYHWSYDGNDGPASWSKHYEFCGGMRQSPININTNQVEWDESLHDFDLSRFEVPTRPIVFNITNNGHSASCAVNNDMFCSGGGLPDAYKTAGFHFHWGADDQRGSEHGIDGRNYPLEMHIVNYAVKYGSLNKAKTKSDGLAVLGVMFEISEQDNPDFDPIFRALINIRHEGEHDTITDLQLGSLLPTDTSHFYRYTGSLTTPPCFESVIWTIFAIPQKISAKQLSVLRSLILDGDHGDVAAKDVAQEQSHSAYGQASSRTNVVKFMVDNYRPFQDLHGRIVKKSFRTLKDVTTNSRQHLDTSTVVPNPEVHETHSPKNNMGAAVGSESTGSIVQVDSDNGAFKQNTIVSGANAFPDLMRDVINSANTDQKAAATETRIALSEQFTDIKLNSAHEALLNPKAHIHYHIANSTENPVTNSATLSQVETKTQTMQSSVTYNTTPAPVTKEEVQPVATPVPSPNDNVQPFKPVPYPAKILQPVSTQAPSSIETVQPGAPIKKLHQITAPSPVPSEKVQPVTALDPEGVNSVVSIENHTPPSWIPPIYEASRTDQAATHKSAAPTAVPVVINSTRLSQVQIDMIKNYVRAAARENVGEIPPNRGDSSGNQANPIMAIGVNPTQPIIPDTSTSSNMNTNPFIQLAYQNPFRNPQFIAGTRERPHQPPQSGRQIQPWMLPKTQIDGSISRQQYNQSHISPQRNQAIPPQHRNQQIQQPATIISQHINQQIQQPATITSQRRPGLQRSKYQPVYRPSFQNKNSVSQRQRQHSNQPIPIDRRKLILALRRLRAMRNGGLQHLRQTTRAPDEPPYVFLRRSRNPVRVSNQFVNGMYDRGTGPGYTALTSALRPLGI